MRARRAVAVAVVLTVAAACGGDSGPSLEEWADQADEICDDARDESDDLEIDTIEDIDDRGEEAVEIAEDAVDDIQALELPGGDDEQVATDLIDAIEDYIAVQEEVLEELGDDGRDELVVTAIAVEDLEVVEDGIDAANEAGAVDCRETFDRRLESLEQAAGVIEDSGELGEVRVGDCLTDVEVGELAPVDCDGDDAEGEVTATSLTGGECLDGEDSVGGGAGITFCFEPLGPPPEDDGVLEVGSCILLQEAAGDSVDVTEFGCEELAVTHEVVADVLEDENCLDGERRFAKSDEEIERSGEGEWCARRR